MEYWCMPCGTTQATFEIWGGGGSGGEKSGPSYSTYAVKQLRCSMKRILADPAVVSTATTSGSGKGEKPSPCQVIFSPPYTLTTVLFSDSVLGPQPSPSITWTDTWTGSP